MKLSVRDITKMAMMTAVLYSVKVIFESLPNIEGVTMIIICYSMVFKWKTLYIVNVFNLLEIFQWGFGWWNIGYFMAWNLLVAVSIALKEYLENRRNRVMFSILCGGVFGLVFAVTYIPISVTYAVNYWISGLSFDLIHMIGNGVVTAVFSDIVIKILREER